MGERSKRPAELPFLAFPVRESAAAGQALYHGFSNLREADHDADLYRLYQKAIENIARNGGKETRVILDSELKRIVYRDLARSKRMTNAPDFAAIAEHHGLKMIRGNIPVPDLRIEYESAAREQARVDLELATEHYRFRNLAKKSAPALRCTPARTSWPNCAGLWTRGN